MPPPSEPPCGRWVPPKRCCSFRGAGTVINPELYADIDLDQRTRDFYQQFFGYELSDEQLGGIFHR